MRAAVKRVLANLEPRTTARGCTVLIYHRVGGGSPDELDVPTASFAEQVRVLAEHDVLGLDAALDRLDRGDPEPSVVLTFDDGFSEVYDNAWPLLRQAQLPFTIYLATAYVDAPMRWPGSTARSSGHGLTWDQLREMRDSGLCTIGNHTHSHARPEALSTAELDICSELISQHLGVTTRHFAWTWGIEVPDRIPELRRRFRSAATGRIGRNAPGQDPLALRRVPVRGSDPRAFFEAKLRGRLFAEQTYQGLVSAAKQAGARG